jgi:hypothetical protein
MTAAKLVAPGALREPEDVAPYFRFGAEYVVDVADAMGWEHSLGPTVEAACEALREGRTEVDDEVERLVGAVLVADAEYWHPIGRWLPRGYALLMRGLSHALRRKLLRIAGVYTDTYAGGPREFYRAHPSVREALDAPVFSRPSDHPIDGVPATEHVRGLSLDAFVRRTVLGDSVLHVEWYEYVADSVGVGYDAALCERAREVSPAYFAGVRDELPDDVRELQRAMFTDDDWIRKFHDEYELRSILFRRAADGIERTAEGLAEEG